MAREIAVRRDAMNAITFTEMRETLDLKVWDSLVVCKQISIRGKEVKVVKLGNTIEDDFGEDGVPALEMGALFDNSHLLLVATLQPANGWNFKPVVQIMRWGERDGDEPKRAC
uniref:Uncharacterized protein n=1 Tax=Odontella aurita TaxID=265563 RepID=A0A7S4JCV3_9STRA|mmetsp:Transcript_43882/g.133656  ORF Transcript_43882/g.133656 Transcript_43882/m.133656 type:complete len:113 (+) Transcript_43882:1430-1768(+)